MSYEDHLLGSPVEGAYAAYGESDDDIDAMVKRNIQDVLLAAEAEESGPTFVTEAETGTNHRNRASHPSLTSQRQAAPLGATRTTASTRANGGGEGKGGLLEASAASSSYGESAGILNSTSALEVPGHAEATLRLHKARIRGLEEECAKLAQALTDRDKQLAEAKKESKALKADQASWTKTQKALEGQLDKQKRAAQDAEAAAASREAALKELGRESAKGDKEKRAGEAEARARDVRLQRALEEVERYKQLLQDVRSGDREGKDAQKGELTRALAENKKLDRQRAELIVAFKKQLRLIDVLKRQKLHLEASRALQFTEQEFLQTLEMGNS